MIDNRELSFPKTDPLLIQRISDRRIGVGSDGVILIENDTEVDFNMIYYNSDGSQSLCGNGSRCAIAFARKLDMIGTSTRFRTTDGIHKGRIEGSQIYFQLHDIKEVEVLDDSYFIENGSPHYVQFVGNLEETDVVGEGRKVRYSDSFKPNGTNVNFVQLQTDNLFVRTYERGVENETLSCGTGVTASAIAASFQGASSPIDIKTLGGTLSVSFNKVNDQLFEEVFLAGPATHVFDGEITI